MFRLRRQTRVAIEAWHTREATDETGGVHRVDDGEPFLLWAVPLGTRRGLALGETGVWGAPSRYILAEKGAGLLRHDRVRLPGETGRLLVFDVRETPRHVRAELREAP